jgi:hypothetical protein
MSEDRGQKSDIRNAIWHRSSSGFPQCRRLRIPSAALFRGQMSEIRDQKWLLTLAFPASRQRLASDGSDI